MSRSRDLATCRTSKPAVVGIDLGGNKLAGAIFNGDGRILRRILRPLDGRQGRQVGGMIQQAIAGLLEMARKDKLAVGSIGICVPGISYSETGKVWAPNIPGWEDYPLRRELESALKNKRIRIAIDSDRACYILGETWRGAAKGCRNAIFLAVGTGIGAGILVDGKVLRGAHDIAGAIGWLALDRPFRPEYVTCGCFEHHASGEGLAKVARELSDNRGGTRGQGRDGAWTAREVFAAHGRGHPVAKEVMRQAIEFWGMAVANLVSLFNPEKIIFGGGVFGPAAKFVDDIHAEARRWAQPIAIKRVRLLASRLGTDAGLCGAGYLALQTTRDCSFAAPPQNP
jgi:glucokinase